MNRTIARTSRRLAFAALLALAASSALPASAGVTGVVNVNTASAEELSALPGVGESRAQAILVLRKQRGSFKRVEDLLEVKGIGEASLGKLRPYLVLEGKTTIAIE